MTKLLFSVRDRKDAIAGMESGADILDIAADDAKALSIVDTVARVLDGKARLSLTASLPFLYDCRDDPLLTRFDCLRVKTGEDGRRADWKKLEQLALKHKTILLIDADNAGPHHWRQLLAGAETAVLYGVMLESYSGNSPRLTRQYAMADIGQFVNDAKHRGLIAGLAGALEPPDIPRLLPYDPDVLGFSFAHMARPGRRGAEESRRLIRSLVPQEQDAAADEMCAVLGTDRILVSDLILPMHIGAYRHEQDGQQRVCFNLAVDVERISINPEDMRHIFSYDLILDAIHRLTSLGHVDLVESLAERIAAFILGYSRVRRVMVRVEKLDLEPRAVGVEIIRAKSRLPLAGDAGARP